MKSKLQRSVVAFCCAAAFAGCQKRSGAVGAGEIDEQPANPTEESAAQLTEASPVGVTSDDPADQYYKAWLLVRKSEKVADREESVRLLQEALGYFAEIKNRHPEWKAAMVEARTQNTKDALAALSESGR